MATEIDPARVMPGAILQMTEFRNARVLEVGAGNGRLTFQYAAHSGAVIGIDTDEKEIRSAAADPRIELRDRARFLCASATALPLPGERFDIVLLASSL